MAAPKAQPPREWRVDDLLDLGRRGGQKTDWLKSVPVLILEKWVQGKREKGVANFIWTKELTRRLESSGLVPPFKPKGSAAVLSALTSIQGARNLSRPKLLEYQGSGRFKVNVPHYEPLLQEYRQEYRELFAEDYRKLFPSAEPPWETAMIAADKPPSDIEPESTGIIQVLEQYDRAWQERLDESKTKSDRLQQEVENLHKELENLRRERDQRSLLLDGIADETLRSRLLPLGSLPLDTLIREAGVVLEDRLRSFARAGSTKHGVGLVDEVLSPKNGTLVFSTHEGEQEGVRMLFRGAMQFIRNPPMHRLIEYHEDTAHLFIRLIDSLLSLLAEGGKR